jgi:GNAT superfamily N-acetyltransferase
MQNAPLHKQDISIRSATDQDSEAILALLFNIWINEYQFNVKKEDFPDLHKIETSYLEKGGRFLVAVHKNQIIGTIACEKLNDSCFALKRMFLEKNFRGQGIAQLLYSQLLKEVIPSSGNTNRVSFYLSTKEDTALAAKKFYLKNGFKVITRDELPSNFPFFYEDDLFMMNKIKTSSKL